MKYELKCCRCNEVSEHTSTDKNFKHVLNIIRREMTVEFCPICGKSTLQGLVSFEEEPKKEVELTDQQKDLIERCNK